MRRVVERRKLPRRMTAYYLEIQRKVVVGMKEMEDTRLGWGTDVKGAWQQRNPPDPMLPPSDRTLLVVFVGMSGRKSSCRSRGARHGHSQGVVDRN